MQSLTGGNSIPFQLALLGWNGTLLDDLDVAYAATVHLFELIAPRATVPTLEEYRQEFSSSQMLECYYTRGGSRTVAGDRICRAWRAHYEFLCDHTRLADGAEKMLRFLRKCGIPIIIVSAASKETIRHIERLGIAHLFDRICFEVRDKEQTIRQILDREKVAAHDAFYVSDTTDDIAHGKQAKIVTFGYMRGYNSPDRIREAKPKYMVESLIDVFNIVRANIN